MEVIFSARHFSKCFLLGLYCCLSFLFFCAFYQYTASRYSLTPQLNYSEFRDEVRQQATATIPRGSKGNGTIGKMLRQSGDEAREYPRQQHSNGTGVAGSSRFPAWNIPMRQAQFNQEEVTGQAPSVQSPLTVPRPETSLEATSSEGSSCRSLESKPKLILLWTSFFETWDYFPPGPFGHCPSCTNCLVTTDRSRLPESDAVIFHARNVFLADLPLQRSPHQRWVFYCLESPPYSDFAGFQFMHRMFNWTMTYRTDSDVVTQYGVVEKIRPRKPLDRALLRSVWEKKTRSVVWMSSHCPTDGGRDNFVHQLRKYIDVDEYGTCGTMECPIDATTKCLTDFALHYKFFLAFENSICKDYVTEKFYRTLKYDIVPVVFGGAQYEKFAPPGSYIDALQFKSPKHLAYFLAGVGRDFSLYTSYFEWRTEFSVRTENSKECALCSLLHDNRTKPSVYEDIRKWWVGDGACRTWRPKG